MLRRLSMLIAGLTLVFGLTVSIAAPVYAVDVISPVCDNIPAGQSGGTPTVCKDSQAAKTGSNPLVGQGGLLTTYIHILALVIGVGAVLVIMLAGFRFIISGGEPQAIATARNTILYAIVGLVVASLTQIIVTFVLGRL